MFEFVSIEPKDLARAPRGTVGVFILSTSTTVADAQIRIQSYCSRAGAKVSTRGMYLVDPASNRTQRLIQAKVAKAGRPAQPRGRKPA